MSNGEVSIGQAFQFEVEKLARKKQVVFEYSERSNEQLRFEVDRRGSLYRGEQARCSGAGKAAHDHWRSPTSGGFLACIYGRILTVSAKKFFAYSWKKRSRKRSSKTDLTPIAG